MIPTSLDVFKLTFDVNTPAFLVEASENNHGGMYPVCWVIFRDLLAAVATRATELDDPVMNVLMIRLGLYDISPGERYRVIDQIKRDIMEEKE